MAEDNTEDERKKQIQDRVLRLRRFIEYHSRAFADCAERGFNSHGRGAVMFQVAALEGGAEFRPQPVGLTLHYMSREQVVGANPRPPLPDMVDAYQAPEEAVIVAAYPDGSYDSTRVAIRALAQRTAGPQAQLVQHIPQGPQNPPGIGGPGSPGA